jgi:hypothetical protein
MVKAFSADHRGNRLLELLPKDEYEQLKPLLRETQLAQGQVLYEAKSKIEQFYFPRSHHRSRDGGK